MDWVERIVASDTPMYKPDVFAFLIERLPNRQLEMPHLEWWDMCLKNGLNPIRSLQVLYRNGVYCENIRLHESSKKTIGRRYLIDLDKQSHGKLVRRARIDHSKGMGPDRTVDCNFPKFGSRLSLAS